MRRFFGAFIAMSLWAALGLPAVGQTAPAAPAAPAAAKKTSITCIKGKTSKKVTAVNPTCPKGFKKK